MMNLSAPHLTELEIGSAIARDVIAERVYETVGKKEVPTQFRDNQKGAGLLMPIYNVYGEQASYQLKRNEPRVLRGKALKYETPYGSSVMIDVPPRCRQYLGNPKYPLWITEGIKKTDSAVSAGVDCIVGISGVFNWRGSSKNDGLTALGDWEAIAFKYKDGTPRDVLLALDSDIRSNPNVQKAVKRLKRFLVSKGANVKILVMPDLEDGSKCGLDDWFANGGTLEGLREFVQDDVPAEIVDRGSEAPYSDQIYRATPNGFFRVGTKDGDEIHNPMTDFTAWIVAQTSHPERPELNYAEIVLRNSRGRLQGPFRVLDTDFRQVDGRNGWLGMFGSSHRVYAGVTNPHLVNAIQVASGDVPTITVYDRLGWMQDAAGDWHYLTAAGAHGANGLDTTIRVEPGGRLNEYQTQDASDSETLRGAVVATLDMQSIANTDKGVAAVVVTQAAMLRALLSPARRQSFTTTIVGETGSGKSALAGLALQMFGPAFTYNHLTDSWNSTLNSLIDIASRARHAPLVIDDYVEMNTGSSGVARQSQSRDTLIRMVANAIGRGRLNANASRNDSPEPETGLISTQETTGSFRHASEAARQLIVKVEKRGGDDRDLDIGTIKQYTRDYGRTGVYNLALSGYVQHLAADMDNLIAGYDDLHDQATDTLTKRIGALGLHEQTLPALASLKVGWDSFVSFALATGAIDQSRADHERETGLLALISIAQDQATEQDADRPELLIVELLQDLFSTRQASLRDRATDGPPSNAVLMGWKVTQRPTLTGTDTQYQSASKEIGWIDDEFVYLIPSAASQALQAPARDTQRNIPAGERQLGTVLVRSGIAAPGEAGKATKQIEVGALSESGGSRKRAIRIPREVIFPELVAPADESVSTNITEIRRSA